MDHSAGGQVLSPESRPGPALSPLGQTREQLRPRAQLQDEDQVSGAEVGSLQLRQVGVAQALEGLVFLQRGSPVLGVAGHDLGSQHAPTGLLPALPHHAEAAPREEARARLVRGQPAGWPRPDPNLREASPGGRSRRGWQMH